MLLFREIGHRQNRLWKYSWKPEMKIVGAEVAPVPIPVIVRPDPALAETFSRHCRKPLLRDSTSAQINQEFRALGVQG